MVKKSKFIFIVLALCAAINLLSGCALLVVGGAGAAAGYEGAKHGYTVQSPVTKH